MTFLQFRDGPLLSEEAVLLALDLEKRGHVMTVRGDLLEGAKLNFTQTAKLTAADREAIARVRQHLLALVGYIEEGHEAK